jgi:hypothetical protein
VSLEPSLILYEWRYLFPKEKRGRWNAIVRTLRAEIDTRQKLVGRYIREEERGGAQCHFIDGDIEKRIHNKRTKVAIWSKSSAHQNKRKTFRF